VNFGSKIRFLFSSFIPFPLSETVIIILSSFEITLTSIEGFSLSCLFACVAFLTKLVITLINWVLSKLAKSSFSVGT